MFTSILSMRSSFDVLAVVERLSMFASSHCIAAAISAKWPDTCCLKVASTAA